MEIRIHSPMETKALACKIADALPRPALLCLSGDLGAGKTTFTKYLAQALGYTDRVTSPTFTILKSYENGDETLHHIDAYRLEGIVQDLGFEEIFDEEKSVCVVEWYDFIEYALPKERLSIDIKIIGEERLFNVDAHGESYQACLEACL